ncbi:MAG: T9SS type A sorting domain-containing protein, partial [Bacteroidetes bacterium]|nr:T9SS type A sorting domain-containing protein [Bacteroidota bacterium]
CNGSACDTITKTIQRYAAVANFSVTPDPAPFPWITTVNFTDESFTLINTWNWDFDDGGFSTLQNPSHNFTSVGTYNVTLDVDNGFCIGQIVQEVNVLKTGITATSKFSFKVYPNPASNYFTIVLPNNSDNITLEIFNVLGERIYAEALLKGHALMKNIDVDDLQGMYFIKISGGDYYAINKIVVR